MARKRKIQCNQPVGVKWSKGRTANDPKNVSAPDQVTQFPNERFIVSQLGKLFCLACPELSTKESVLELHIKSAKHLKGKEALNFKQLTSAQEI